MFEKKNYDESLNIKNDQFYKNHKMSLEKSEILVQTQDELGKNMKKTPDNIKKSIHIFRKS